METILIILLTLMSYGFGFLSGVIKKSETKEDHNNTAIHFNSVSEDE